MGCFSYLCDECGEGIMSDSSTGELCRIYALSNGRVIDEVRGHYDSYGGVIETDFKINERNHGDNTGDGFAVVHEACFEKVPTEISRRDPDQGWGVDSLCLSAELLLGEDGRVDRSLYPDEAEL